jgi:uncharacterized protein (TIGR00661 family)
LKAKVIIAPLNWGLGHATRSIPLIRSFIEKDWEVVLASDGDALTLLQAEFPSLRSHELPGYDITYPYRNIVGNLFRNLRSFSNGAYKEFQVIQEIVKEEKPDLILSDNRYGVRSSSCKSIFLGHQITLKAGNPLFSYFASRINQRLISQFDELWVPDYENGMALAGVLSKTKLAIPVQYIGPLSRFEKLDDAIEYDLCAIISGPEPQRSRFQKVLIEQLSVLDENTVIVLGDVHDHSDEMLNETTRVIGHLKSDALNKLVNRSKIIIARSGYSTIMDMDKLGKQAILVPTPGQTEQLYLAHHLANRPQFVMQSQKKINIPHALEKLLQKQKIIQRKSSFDIDDYLVVS